MKRIFFSTKVEKKTRFNEKEPYFLFFNLSRKNKNQRHLNFDFKNFASLCLCGEKGIYIKRVPK